MCKKLAHREARRRNRLNLPFAARHPAPSSAVTFRLLQHHLTMREYFFQPSPCLVFNKRRTMEKEKVSATSTILDPSPRPRPLSAGREECRNHIFGSRRKKDLPVSDSVSVDLCLSRLSFLCCRTCSSSGSPRHLGIGYFQP